MDGYSFHESLDDCRPRRAVAALFAPGERVTVDERFAGEPEVRTFLSATGNGVLTVKAVHVVSSDKALYEFDEVPGQHPYSRFVDVRPMVHVYGTLSMVDGAPWLVEFEVSAEEGGADQPSGRCLRLSGVSGRYVAWNDGLTDSDDLAAFAEEGACGEFVAVQEEDGCWKLTAIPWSTCISDEEQILSEEAVAASRDAVPVMGVVH